MNRSQMKKEMQGGKGGGALCGPGAVANKSPKSIKASPRKKLAMGAKSVVKGSNK
jgi:hypothetical protein